MRMNVDIKFIAKMTAVSPATVSRVVNSSKYVSPDVKSRVLDAIAKYNYRPNSMARGLILKQSNLLGVMVPKVSSLFHSSLISYIEECANPLGYNVIISNVHQDFAHQKSNFLGLCERQVDGIILVHENSQEELTVLRGLSPVPLVTASINFAKNDVTCVSIDDELAAYELTSYLIRLGHKKIGGIFNDCYSLGVLRKNGFERALRENNLPICEAWQLFGDCTIESGFDCAKQLFTQKEKPTAIFCVSDEIAVGVIGCLTDMHYCVPRDVSVTGFDDIVLSQAIRPRLTTVHQPIKRIGEKAVQSLLLLIKDTMLTPTHITLPFSLEIRDSCVPPAVRGNVGEGK